MSRSPRVTGVPLQAGEIIGPGLLNKVLRDCQANADDILKLLRGE